MTLIKRHRNELPVFGDMMATIFDDPFFKPTHTKSIRSTPLVNISESKESYNVNIAAPGINKEDFSIDLKENVLVISAKAKASEEAKSEKFTRREFNYTEFKRSFNLPEDANKEKISANHVNGVLEVKIPKAEPKKEVSKNIQIG